jgi:HK97 gp10 family phage protein
MSQLFRTQKIYLDVLNVEANMSLYVKRKKYFDPREALRNMIEDVVKESSTRITKKAKREAPKDTGFLRASIKNRINRWKAAVTVWAHYGKYVEFGTIFMSANPFFRRALEDTKRVLPTILRRAYRRNFK